MYPHLSNQKKKGKKKKREGPRTSTITKLLHQTRATFFTAVHSLSISVTDLADSRSSTAFFLFFARITVPLSIFVSHLCCLKILRTRQKNTFAFDSWRLTERRWRRRRRRHCRWSPACSWTA